MLGLRIFDLDTGRVEAAGPGTGIAILILKLIWPDTIFSAADRVDSLPLIAAPRAEWVPSRRIPRLELAVDLRVCTGRPAGIEPIRARVVENDVQDNPNTFRMC